jgi:hypothetical protein
MFADPFLVVAIGDSVRLKITGSCPRCVMATLPQGAQGCGDTARGRPT